MYNPGKKAIGLLGGIVFFMGSFSFGLTCDTNTPCPAPLKCDSGICVNTEATTVTASNCDGGKIIAGICSCPDGKKRIEKKGCVPCTEEGVCCGIELNTNVPFIGNCIELSKESSSASGTDTDETTVTEKTAFPKLMGGLTKMMVTIILLIGFMGILAGGVMISASGGDDTRASEGKKLIGKVIVALALLGASGVILRLINPNFFG